MKTMKKVGQIRGKMRLNIGATLSTTLRNSRLLNHKFAADFVVDAEKYQQREIETL